MINTTSKCLRQPVSIVSGIHRSGTTWLGRVLERCEDVAVLHEPFNKDVGLRGLPCWYPYLDEHGPVTPEQEIVVKVVDSLWAGRARFIRWRLDSPPIKNFARTIFGSQSERRYCRALSSTGGRMLIKDPFALFLLRFLIYKYSVKAVVMVRHPGAHFMSMRRMNWEPPLKDIYRQQSLRERYAYDLPWRELLESAHRSLAAANSWFWVVAQRFLLSLVQRYPEAVMMVRHEDVTLAPAHYIEPVSRHLGFSDSSGAAVQFAVESTRGRTIVPRAGVLHEFSRDGAGLVDRWRHELSSRDIETISQITCETYNLVYPGRPF